MNTDTMGVYGNYYLKRAIVTQLGLGANLPEDAIYPLNLADDTGKPLDGANNYMLHFDKGATPPVNAFWSVTLYDAEGFQVANSLNRFAVSSWMPFKIQCGRLARPLFPERQPRRGQGGQLAAGAEGPVQPDDAALRAEERGAGRQDGTRRRSFANRRRRVYSAVGAQCRQGASPIRGPNPAAATALVWRSRLGQFESGVQVAPAQPVGHAQVKGG